MENKKSVSIIPSLSSGLRRVSKSFEITQKILSRGQHNIITEPQEFWNSLNRNWKLLFLYQLEPDKTSDCQFGPYYRVEPIQEILSKYPASLDADMNTISTILKLESFEYLFSSSEVNNFDLPKIDTLAPFKHLSKLKTLHLCNLADDPKLIFDLNNGVGFEKNIEELSVCHDHSFLSLYDFQHFKNLTKLNYTGFFKEQSDGIKFFKKLQELHIDYEIIENPNTLGNLSTLRRLHLGITNKDLNTLSQISLLEKLLPNCKIVY